MHTTEFGINKLIEAKDFWDHRERPTLDKYVEEMAKCFTKGKLFQQMITAYANATGLEGYTLLKAHGNVRKGKWTFFDGKKPYIMQNWIDKVDGSSLAILLHCCNPENSDIESSESIIIHPRDTIGIKEIIMGGYMRIYVPGEGYLENNDYKLRKAIKKYK